MICLKDGEGIGDGETQTGKGEQAGEDGEGPGESAQQIREFGDGLGEEEGVHPVAEIAVNAIAGDGADDEDAQEAPGGGHLEYLHGGVGKFFADGGVEHAENAALGDSEQEVHQKED